MVLKSTMSEETVIVMVSVKKVHCDCDCDRLTEDRQSPSQRKPQTPAGSAS